MIVNRMPNIFYKPYDENNNIPFPFADDFEFLSGEDWLLLDGENLELLE